MFYGRGPWSGKNLLGKNTLEFDYFPAASATKTNRLKTLTHVINALKLFVTSAWAKAFVPVNFSDWIFAGKATSLHIGKANYLFANIRLGQKILAFTYFASVSVTNTKRFKTLTHVINTLKLFVTDAVARAFVPGNFSDWIFAGSKRRLPLGKPPSFIANIRLGRKGLSGTNNLLHIFLQLQWQRQKHWHSSSRLKTFFSLVLELEHLLLANFLVKYLQVGPRAYLLGKLLPHSQILD
jgi:hypothetical protein